MIDIDQFGLSMFLYKRFSRLCVGGALTQPPESAMDEAVAMVARSLWSVQVLKILRSLSRAPDGKGL